MVGLPTPYFFATSNTVAVNATNVNPLIYEFKSGIVGDLYPCSIVTRSDLDRDVCIHPSFAYEDPPVEPMFVIENVHVGGIIHDFSVFGELVPCRMFRRGDWVLAFLAIENEIHIGDTLVYAGSGEVKKQDPLLPRSKDRSIIGYALQYAPSREYSQRVVVEVV
jgi:hypothetical protein